MSGQAIGHVSGVGTSRELRSVVVRVAKAVSEALADERVRRSTAGRLPLVLDDERELARSIIVRHLDVLAGEHLATGLEPLDEAQESLLVDAVLAKVLGLGRIQPLLDDPDISDIHIRGCASTRLKLIDGRRVAAAPVIDSDEELVELVRIVADPCRATSPRLEVATVPRAASSEDSTVVRIMARLLAPTSAALPCH